MVVGALPFRVADKISGEIEHSVASELVLSETHSVPAERKGGRWPVLDGLPPVEAHMQNERALHFNEKIAVRGQCIERSVSVRQCQVPTSATLRRKCFSTLFNSSIGRFSCRVRNSLRNSACAQTRGIAPPVGLPGSNPR